MRFFNFFSSHKETNKQSQESDGQTEAGMFADLSQTQKFAIVSMLASLAAAPTNPERIAMAQKMMLSDTAMMGITQDMMLSYMRTHGKHASQEVITTLRTIKNASVLEWLIYCGYGIIAVNQNDKAKYVYLDWWQQLGYTPEEVYCVVRKVEASCNEMRKMNF